MLSSSEIEVLRAAVNRIIPADDYPAGWEAGVGDYLMQQFTADLQQHISTYQHGLAYLEAEAKAVYQASFINLSPLQLDALLTRIEQNQVTTHWQTDPAEFFTLLVNHSMEGFYSDPQNGGNHNSVAWDMIGFEVRG